MASTSLPRFEELLAEQHLLISKHTRRYLREEHYFPGPAIDRANRSRWLEEGGLTLGARAHGQVEKLVVEYEPSGLPDEVKAVFEHDRYHYESEDSYRALVEKAGYSVSFMCLVPPSGWDNYYAHMARRLEDRDGFFSDPQVKLAHRRQLEAQFRRRWSGCRGYVLVQYRRHRSSRGTRLLV